MLAKRTNILFEEETWTKLVALSQRKEKSVGDLVRLAVRKVYFSDIDINSRARVVDKILKTRKIVKGINYRELIDAGRKY